MTMLSFQNLSIKMREQHILKNVSGAIRRGRVTVILGANGAGKTTLLSCLATLKQPDSGTVKIDNRSIFNTSLRERAKCLGLLPQKADILWNVDVQTIVGLGRLPHHGRWGMTAADHNAIEKAMLATNCADLADRKAWQLSGGEQGRVLLARVFAGEPDWLLADEPLASLDPAHQFDILSRLRAYAMDGAGVVIVMHDITQAARFADDVIIMKAGTILASGPRADVMTKDNMALAYGIEVQLGSCDNGELLLVPVSRRV